MDAAAAFDVRDDSFGEDERAVGAAAAGDVELFERLALGARVQARAQRRRSTDRRSRSTVRPCATGAASSTRPGTAGERAHDVLALFGREEEDDASAATGAADFAAPRAGRRRRRRWRSRSRAWRCRRSGLCGAPTPWRSAAPAASKSPASSARSISMEVSAILPSPFWTFFLPSIWRL